MRRKLAYPGFWPSQALWVAVNEAQLDRGLRALSAEEKIQKP